MFNTTKGQGVIPASEGQWSTTFLKTFFILISTQVVRLSVQKLFLFAVQSKQDLLLYKNTGLAACKRLPFYCIYKDRYSIKK